MSIRVMTRVWEHSTSSGGPLLVLLAIADFADDRGVAYPSMETLGAKARLDPRNAQRAVRRLERAGELEVTTGKGPHGTNLFRVRLAETVQPSLGVTSAPGGAKRRGWRRNHQGGGATTTTPVAPAPPEPSPEPSLEPSEGAAAPNFEKTPTSAQEERAYVRAVADQWRAARRKPGLERFTDAAAIRNLKTAAGRAWAAGCSLQDAIDGIRQNAGKPDANPWYVDEWARLARGAKADADLLQRNLRARDEEGRRWHERHDRPRSIGELLAKTS
jgi:hypothetical protein